MEANMQSPTELVDAINRISDSTNFLAREVIDIRDQIDGARTLLLQITSTQAGRYSGLGPMLMKTLAESGIWFICFEGVDTTLRYINVAAWPMSPTRTNFRLLLILRQRMTG